MENKQWGLVLVSAIVAAFIGAGTFYFLEKWEKPSKQELIEEFYQIENAVHVSPHSLRKMMDKQDKSYILVDLRSQEEYQKEHIVGAVNIPAYRDKDHSAYDEVERITQAFLALPQNKDIIVYCYSTPCMTGRKVGAMLTEKGVYVKHLGIGWNEWRYHWTLWNHEHEWNTTKPEEYIFSGNEPGTPLAKELPAPCGEGQFGC